MKDISKLFDNRSKSYNDIYGHSTPTRLLHQEKRVRARVAKELALKYSSDIDREVIIDVGCGMGNLLSSLKKEKQNVDMYGYDISQEMIDLAKESGDSDIKFRTGNLSEIKFKANTVLSLGVMGYQQDQKAFLINLTKVVAPEGYLIFSTANGDSVLRSFRQSLYKLHTIITRKTKDAEFLSIKDSTVNNILDEQKFELEEKVHMTFGLGVYPSKIECSIDRFLFRFFSKKRLAKYLSLTVVYVYKKSALVN